MLEDVLMDALEMSNIEKPGDRSKMQLRYPVGG